MSDSVQPKLKRGIVVAPYTLDLVDAVKAFNARLRAGGVAMGFPETNVPEWLPPVAGREIFQEYYVAVDQDAVRGTYILKHQPFWVAGQTARLSQFRLPLSEGQINKHFAAVGVQIYLDAVRKQKLLYTVGIGGYQEAVAQMLLSAGWKTQPVSFFFRVFHPRRFLRNIVYLRTTPLRRFALDAMAVSGLGTVAVHAYQALKAQRPAPIPQLEWSEVNSFGGWADAIWEGAKSDYSLIAVRNATILDILYPASEPQWIRLKVTLRGEVVGWAVLLNEPMNGHNYFGNLRVGSLIDCLALPGHEDAVVCAAIRHSKREKAEILVTNLSHHRWRSAAESQGLCSASSNFIFAASKPVAAMIESVDAKMERIHMTRGDGSGPENLLASRK
ncbi:MAG TPA: hypothetical protein VHY91_06810 [Pirellulales bacterium]|jgi:hypothetical protein|nr:hypothetical protein [Pirellulales bacterium]